MRLPRGLLRSLLTLSDMHAPGYIGSRHRTEREREGIALKVVNSDTYLLRSAVRPFTTLSATDLHRHMRVLFEVAPVERLLTSKEVRIPLDYHDFLEVRQIRLCVTHLWD